MTPESISGTVSIALSNIGTIYLDSGDFEKADKYFRGSLEISEKLKDILGVGYSLHWKGVLSPDKGDIDDAMS